MGNGLKVAAKTDYDHAVRSASEDEDSNDEEDDDEDDNEEEYEDEESSEDATSESFCDTDNGTAEIAIERQAHGVASAEDKQEIKEKLVQATENRRKQTSETQLMNGTSQLKLKSMSLPMIAKPSKPNNTHLQNTKKVTISPNKFGKFKKKRKVSKLSKTKSASVRSLLKESRNPKTQVAIEKERELRELQEMVRKSETIKPLENVTDNICSQTDQLNVQKERTFQSTSELTGVAKLTRAKTDIAKEYDQKRKAKMTRQKKTLELGSKLETEQRRVKQKQNKVVKCVDIYRGHSVTKRVKPHSLIIRQKEWTF